MIVGLLRPSFEGVAVEVVVAVVDGPRSEVDAAEVDGGRFELAVVLEPLVEGLWYARELLVEHPGGGVSPEDGRLRFEAPRLREGVLGPLESPPDGPGDLDAVTVAVGRGPPRAPGSHVVDAARRPRREVREQIMVEVPENPIEVARLAVRRLDPHEVDVVNVSQRLQRLQPVRQIYKVLHAPKTSPPAGCQAPRPTKHQPNHRATTKQKTHRHNFYESHSSSSTKGRNDDDGPIL
mmetsp:Transcript_16034/g.52207  ORF Transcript_16034/g.52207 Transcript_16034/m.52207 type:complete len:236 (-) Transcript_16034:65-772(-)